MTPAQVRALAARIAADDRISTMARTRVSATDPTLSWARCSPCEDAMHVMCTRVWRSAWGVHVCDCCGVVGA